MNGRRSIFSLSSTTLGGLVVNDLAWCFIHFRRHTENIWLPPRFNFCVSVLIFKTAKRKNLKPGNHPALSNNLTHTSIFAGTKG